MDCFKWLFSKKPVVAPPPTVETHAPVDLPPPIPWLDLALSHVGQKECNKFDDDWIVSLFKNTSYGVAESSKVPWCAAFVCSMLQEAGYKHPRSARAKDMAKLGYECVPQAGAVMVWKHKYGELAGHYHTNFMIERVDGKLFRCCGGNQLDSVTIANYSLDAYDLYAARMPVL